MKKFSVFLIVALISIIGIVYSSTTTDPNVTKLRMYRQTQGYGRIKVAFDSDVNNATVTLPTINGELLGFVADQTGSDTAWSLTIKDEHGVTLFTSAIMDISSDPNRYALSTADSGGNDFYGVPVFGAGSITIADANNASMTDLDIYIYYKDWQK